jgi:hypothetical protein
MSPALVLAIMLAGGPASADSIESITVTAQACKRIVEHVPAKDVEYKPGVSVRGKAVVPADLNGGSRNLVPDEITINIGVDLADRLGRARAKAAGQAPTAANKPILPYTGTAAMGTVTVSNGQVLWNGQPLATDDQAALAAACRKSMAAAEPPPRKPEPPVR